MAKQEKSIRAKLIFEKKHVNTVAMVKTKYIWLNGKYVLWDIANIHLLTHSLHYGSAVFEGIRFYETKKEPAVFRLDDHIKRLFFSAETMAMKVPYSQKEMMRAVLKLIKKNSVKSGYIRPIIFYGGKMGLDPTGAEVHAAIACWPWGNYLEKEVVKVKISAYIRLHPKTSSMEAKISGHYFNSILATVDAKKSGFDEALLLDYSGNIAEGPGENIFFVRNKKIYTPPIGSILPGITRNTVMRLAEDFGYRVFEKNIKPRDIKNVDEAFFTGTAAEITAIGRIGTIKIGSGKEGEITKKIKETYHQVVRGKLKGYDTWLHKA